MSRVIVRVSITTTTIRKGSQMDVDAVLAELRVIAENLRYCLHESPKRWGYEQEDEYGDGYQRAVDQLQDWVDEPLEELERLIERVDHDNWQSKPPTLPTEGQLALWERE